MRIVERGRRSFIMDLKKAYYRLCRKEYYERRVEEGLVKGLKNLHGESEACVR